MLCQERSPTSQAALCCIFTFAFIAEAHFAGNSLKGVRSLQEYFHAQSAVPKGP
jgi:hypothetical protein